MDEQLRAEFERERKMLHESLLKEESSLYTYTQEINFWRYWCLRFYDELIGKQT